MVAGVIFSLLAAIALNTGNLVQKQAVSRLPEVSARRARRMMRTLASSRRWLGGLALCLLGLAFQIMAFALAPIPVVQSIFNAGIVLLIVLSRLKLGERLDLKEWVGLTIVVVSLVAISASLTEGPASVGVSGTGIRVLLAVLPTLIVVALVVGAIRSGSGHNGFLFGIAAGLLYGAAALGTKGASTLIVRHGLLASIPSIFTSIYPYVFLIFSVLGMLMYQTGLQRFRIAVVGSISDVVCGTYVVAIGMVVFGESLPSDPVTLALRFGGFAGVLVGSVFVATGGQIEVHNEPMPSESDLGLGEVLAAEVGALTGQTIDEIVTGSHADGP